MKVLVLEDLPSTAARTEKWFKKRGHDPTVRYTSAGVKDALRGCEFDCYVIDLNAGAIGLTKEQAERSQSGLLTGWILLTEHILVHDQNAMRKTIVFSDFVSDLKEHINSRASEQEKAWFSALESNGTLVSKNDGYGALKSALERVL